LTATKKSILTFVIIVLVFTQSGCAILQVPIHILDGVFSIVKSVLRIVEKLPMPPPGVF